MDEVAFRMELGFSLSRKHPKAVTGLLEDAAKAPGGESWIRASWERLLAAGQLDRATVLLEGANYLHPATSRTWLRALCKDALESSSARLRGRAIRVLLRLADPESLRALRSHCEPVADLRRDLRHLLAYLDPSGEPSAYDRREPRAKRHMERWREQWDENAG